MIGNLAERLVFIGQACVGEPRRGLVKIDLRCRAVVEHCLYQRSSLSVAPIVFCMREQRIRVVLDGIGVNGALPAAFGVNDLRLDVGRHFLCRDITIEPVTAVLL